MPPLGLDQTIIRVGSQFVPLTQEALLPLVQSGQLDLNSLSPEQRSTVISVLGGGGTLPQELSEEQQASLDLVQKIADIKSGVLDFNSLPLEDQLDMYSMVPDAPKKRQAQKTQIKKGKALDKIMEISLPDLLADDFTPDQQRQILSQFVGDLSLNQDVQGAVDYINSLPDDQIENLGVESKAEAIDRLFTDPQFLQAARAAQVLGTEGVPQETINQFFQPPAGAQDLNTLSDQELIDLAQTEGIDTTSFVTSPAPGLIDINQAPQFETGPLAAPGTFQAPTALGANIPSVVPPAQTFGGPLPAAPQISQTPLPAPSALPPVAAPAPVPAGLPAPLSIGGQVPGQPNIPGQAAPTQFGGPAPSPAALPIAARPGAAIGGPPAVGANIQQAIPGPREFGPLGLGQQIPQELSTAPATFATGLPANAAIPGLPAPQAFPSGINLGQETPSLLEPEVVFGAPGPTREDAAIGTPLGLSVTGLDQAISPEARALVEQIFGAQRELGTQNILEGARELAGSRGLNVFDTPVANPALRNLALFESQLGGAEAQSILDFSRQFQEFQQRQREVQEQAVQARFGLEQSAQQFFEQAIQGRFGLELQQAAQRQAARAQQLDISQRERIAEEQAIQGRFGAEAQQAQARAEQELARANLAQAQVQFIESAIQGRFGAEAAQAAQRETATQGRIGLGQQERALAEEAQQGRFGLATEQELGAGQLQQGLLGLQQQERGLLEQAIQGRFGLEMQQQAQIEADLVRRAQLQQSATQILEQALQGRFGLEVQQAVQRDQQELARAGIGLDAQRFIEEATQGRFGLQLQQFTQREAANAQLRADDLARQSFLESASQGRFGLDLQAVAQQEQAVQARFGLGLSGQQFAEQAAQGRFDLGLQQGIQQGQLGLAGQQLQQQERIAAEDAAQKRFGLENQAGQFAETAAQNRFQLGQTAQVQNTQLLEATRQFQEQLRQKAFENRLLLGSTTANVGTNLAQSRSGQAPTTTTTQPGNLGLSTELSGIGLTEIGRGLGTISGLFQ